MILLLLFVANFAIAHAHVLNMTRVRVSFDDSAVFKAEVDIDLTQLLGSSQAYYDLSLLAKEAQAGQLSLLTAALMETLTFHFGDAVVEPELVDWRVPVVDRAHYDDYYVGKMTHLVWQGRVPASRAPFVLGVAAGAPIEYPIAFTVERTDRGVRKTRWMDVGGQESQLFDYEQVQPAESTRPMATGPAVSGAELPGWQRAVGVQVDALWRYLKLGFQHIVPGGLDHILFVLGLFFLGISWRKLLSQTTVFTVAHATTLYLSTQGIFSLPQWFVEPAIAASIAFVALENIFKPRLHVFRLVVVFCFGLIHGLGFASSLSEVPMPKREFLTALLGFNFGVDFGQLFVIGVAFLCVGWFRKKAWYFTRIAVPCCWFIAAIGFVWAIQRVTFFAMHLPGV